MSGLFGEYSSRVFALGGILLTLVLGYFTVSVLLVPLVAALFLVYLLDPALVRLQRRDFSAGNAFLLIMAGFVITIGLVASFIPSWVGVESFSGSDAAFTDRLSLQ
jgi:predicted PurR-regulated permease PerM